LPKISRRRLLGAAGAGGLAVALAACDAGQPTSEVLSGDVEAGQIPYVPPSMAPTTGITRFLSSSEASLLDALTSRILPGTPDDPGAREAGAVSFIDNVLAEFDTFDEPTYFAGPFVGVDADADKLPPGVAKLSDDQLERYGFQGAQTPQEFYRAGLAALAAYSMSSIGVAFDKAAPAQQDLVVRHLATGTASGFDKPKAKDFFKRVRKDTIHAVFSDPVYGGNREFAGWKMIEGPNPSRHYQGLHDLHPANPGRPSPPAVEPVQMPDPNVH
jgi:gluconate 2-dehydrogenase gamma chain